MCYVIITCRSITWTLLTLASTAVIIMAVISPHWLTGPAEWTGQANSLMDNNETIEQVSYRATIGLFNRCTRLERLLESDEDDGGHGEESCTIYVTGFDMSSEEFPDAWKSALILFALAVTLLAFTSFTAVFSLCVQAIFKKSIFTVIVCRDWSGAISSWLVCEEGEGFVW
ncbi:hypothetical protein LSH36_713g01123 [Paralvinella palmiformis]|uniref:Uncharacterized protein n=1 Tax=Paralvinella palmiformis TaxID=53620 RepID=A0AAD9J2R6_9ANNE|nr:hypothetical protein LSH36_713g01123 [Paralvinella palmiformis]